MFTLENGLIFVALSSSDLTGVWPHSYFLRRRSTPAVLVKKTYVLIGAGVNANKIDAYGFFTLTPALNADVKSMKAA